MPVYELAACPVCGTADFQLVADHDDIRHEMEMLWHFHTRRLRPGAPIQQLFDRAVFSQDPPMHLVQCRACATVLRNPRESPGTLVNTYETEEPPTSALEALFSQQRTFYESRVRRLRKMVGVSGSVLEVGSYLGAFLCASTAAGWTSAGIDVNTGANEFARRKGCCVSGGTIADVASGRRYDVVAFWNCFEQLPDPRAALVRAHALLKPGGVIALRIPNGAAYARLRRLPGTHRLLALNNLLGFPYRHGFTADSLEALVSDVGFQDIRVRRDTLVLTASEWTRAWAAAEERVLKRTMRLLFPQSVAPWLELYARRTTTIGADEN